MTLQETSLKEKEAIKIENDLKKLKSAVEKVKDPNARKKLMHHLHKLEKKLENQKEEALNRKRNLKTIYTVAIPFIIVFALLGGYYLVKNKDFFKNES